MAEFERTLGLDGMKIDAVEEWNGDIRITFLAPATDVYFLSNATENVLSVTYHACNICEHEECLFIIRFNMFIIKNFLERFSFKNFSR